MKWIGALLLLVAAFLFFVAGQGLSPTSILLFGFAAGVAGLWLWDEGSSREEDEEDARLAPLQEKIERMETLLLSMQEDFGKVRDDRDFYEKLYKEEPAGILPSKLKD